MPETMTPLERVVAALTFQTPDRVPVALYFQSAIQHDLKRFDYTWEEVLHHSRKLFNVVERQHTYWGADNFFLPCDFRVEGEAFGSKITYMLKAGEGFRIGVVTDWVIKKPDDLKGLAVPDPHKSGRMPVILETIRMLHKKHPNVPIVGFVNGPPDTVTDMVDGHYRRVFTDMAGNPGFVHQCLELATESSITFANAMIEAGAVAIATVEGGMVDEVISPAQYDEFVAPYHAKIREAIGVPYVFHQCENATPFFESIYSIVKPACIAFHDSVDLKWAKEKYGKNVALAGNVGVSKNGTPMLDGTPEDVMEAARKCIEIAKGGSGFLLSGGCEIHHMIPEENIHALVAAAKKYGQY